MKKLAALALILSASTAWATPPADFLVSQFAAHNGDPAQAATSMSQALAADPGNAQLRENAFVFCAAGGR